MAEGTARDLLERLKTDDAFRAQVLAADHPDERLEVIRAAGYACTAEDIAEYAAAVPDDALEELSAGEFTCSAYSRVLAPPSGSCGLHGGYNL